MATVFSFQNQLSSIMDALSKTAVLEISKLVEIESKMLKIEINRGRNEIASLTEKLQLMEKLLYMAQGNRQESTSAAAGVRSVSDSGLVMHPKTRPAINSVLSSQQPRESPRETITSSTDNNLQPKEERPQSIPVSPKEQPELIVIKEEPSDGDCGTTDINRSENRHALTPDIQGSSDVAQCSRSTKLATNRQPPVFTDSFSNRNNQSPHIGSEIVWNLQFSSARTITEKEKILSQNVVPPNNNLSKNVRIHNLRNSSTKKFCCLQCGKSFRCFSQLEIHQRSHTGEKPFRCTLCGKKYAQKGHLYTHQRTHTGEKPYRCPICGKGFIQKCTLDMHQRTHTGEKPFVCVKCGKGFTKNCNLKKHLTVHLDASLHIYETPPPFGSSFINRTT